MEHVSDRVSPPPLAIASAVEPMVAAAESIVLPMVYRGGVGGSVGVGGSSGVVRPRKEALISSAQVCGGNSTSQRYKYMSGEMTA